MQQLSEYRSSTRCLTLGLGYGPGHILAHGLDDEGLAANFSKVWRMGHYFCSQSTKRRQSQAEDHLRCGGSTGSNPIELLIHKLLQAGHVIGDANAEDDVRNVRG